MSELKTELEGFMFDVFEVDEEGKEQQKVTSLDEYVEEQWTCKPVGGC